MSLSKPFRIPLFLVATAIMPNFFTTIQNWRRGLTSNHAKLDPQSDDPLMQPLALPCDRGDVVDAIVWWAGKQPDWSVKSQSEENDWTTIIHLTRKTRLMRFTDDVYVRLEVDGDMTHVDASSQSRFGKGDFGQNQRNLRQLVGALRQNS